MKQVKVSFFLKIIFFIINFVFLFVFLVLQNYFSVFNFLLFVLILLYFVTFFFVLKGNLKAVKFAFLLPIFTFLYYLFGVFDVIIFYFGFLLKFFDLDYDQRGVISLAFLIIGILLFICYFVFLFLHYKKLKKENLDEKYFTTKKQEKTFCVLTGILAILFLAFKFGYYERVEKIDIPEDYFETKLYDKEIQSDKNMYVGMKDFAENLEIKEFSFSLRENVLYCIYEDRCFFEKQDYLDAVNFFKGEKLSEDFSKLKLKRMVVYDENNKYYKNLDENYKNLEGINKINVKILLKKNFENIFYLKENDKVFEKYLEFAEKEYFK